MTLPPAVALPLVLAAALLSTEAGGQPTDAVKNAPPEVAAGKAPEVGDLAPPFTLKGSDGKTYALADLKGRTTVVVAWFPKAFTGG